MFVQKTKLSTEAEDKRTQKWIHTPERTFMPSGFNIS